MGSLPLGPRPWMSLSSAPSPAEIRLHVVAFLGGPGPAQRANARADTRAIVVLAALAPEDAAIDRTQALCPVAQCSRFACRFRTCTDSQATLLLLGSGGFH